MKNKEKQNQILDAMQELMASSDLSAISVSQVAEKAGIGKGSIYYYFSSKNDIIAGVIERSYSKALEQVEHLAENTNLTAFEKLEHLFYASIESARQLHQHEKQITSYYDAQNSAFIHREFARINLMKLKPVLADIFRQGTKEGAFCCETPEETAHIVLVVLTSILDQNPIGLEPEQITDLIRAFVTMQERSFNIPDGTLDFLLNPKIKLDR